ncbi:hypothetical protein CLHOM_30260 [Clostridium homopropionicum DSM 5847]|uniref:Uncharacterized protein n=1 Tax=Clostridium homopropionicum DSM 5847 TaxID=1121318 RepID=A0A0L6Z704_9CLOT|nr:hypothetical protein CLHOM_30260 [Clostridium homopropionicum DSM 5847]SFG54535.1 hypothetical protein SAMN04488501_110163 [Clostridium homopropionicum]
MENSTEIDNIPFLESDINIKSIDTDSPKESILAKDILTASETELINNLVNSNLALKPKLIINDYSKNRKVLSDVASELVKCDEFIMSVAFITSGGVTPLLETLKHLERKGVKGKILTTDYLNFSEPNWTVRNLSWYFHSCMGNWWMSWKFNRRNRI